MIRVIQGGSGTYAAAMKIRAGRKIRAGWALTAALVAVLGAGTGCATSIAGTPTLPGGMPSLSLGDRTRLDPCSVLRVEDLHTAAKLDSDGFFDTCSVEPMRAGSTDVTDEQKRLRLQTGRTISGLKDFNVKMTRTEQDGLDLYTNADGSDDCLRAIGFPDHAVIEIKANNADPDTCAFADTVRAAVLKTLHTGIYQRRSYPQDSLALVDPCPLLPADKALDLVGTARSTRPAIRTCQWAKSGGQGGVELSMETGLELGAGPREDRNHLEQLGGRNTAVAPDPGQPGVSVCSVRTTGRPYGRYNVEDATVLAVVKGSVDQACALGRSVAQEVWPRLPKG